MPAEMETAVVGAGLLNHTVCGTMQEGPCTVQSPQIYVSLRARALFRKGIDYAQLPGSLLTSRRAAKAASLLPCSGFDDKSPLSEDQGIVRAQWIRYRLATSSHCIWRRSSWMGLVGVQLR